MAKEAIQEGAIALLSGVEPCLSFRVRGDRQAKTLRLVMESAKCTHLYHSYPQPEIGLMHIRVQSWFPFSVDVCINGRQGLARQMDRAGIGYRQRDNCFLWIEDCAAAQKLLDEQLASNWPALLQSFLALAHPRHCEISAPMPGLSYYWSASQSEYATDVLFERATQLQQLYPQFLRHAISSFQSPDVLRFLGRKVPQSSGKAHAGFEGEVNSRLQERAEGVRIRHTLNANSLKMYDKESSILRVETTIVRPKDFRVYRAKEGEPKGPKSWRILRKGLSDMYRRAEVGRAANQRYLEALASVTGSSSLLQEAAEVLRSRCPRWETLSWTECFGPERSRFTPGPQPWRVRPQWHPQRRPARFTLPANQTQNSQGRNPPPQCRGHSPICSAASSWLTQKTASHSSLPHHYKRPTNHHRLTGCLLR